MLALALTFALLFANDCARCGTPLREGAKYCTQCGLKAEPAACPKCKTPADPKDKFCAGCGESLAKSDDLAHGYELLKKGDVEGAIKHFTKCLVENPHRPHAYAARARAFAAAGRFDDALEDASRAVALNQDDPTFLELRAEIRLDHGEFDVFADLDRAVKLDPNRPTALRLRVRAWLRKAELDASCLEPALRDADTAVRLDGSAASLLLRGRVRLAVAQDERNRGKDPSNSLVKALGDFDAAIAKEPAMADAWLARAGAWARVAEAQKAQGRDAAESWRKTIADASECLRLDPRRADAWLERGLARSALGEVAAAIADYDHAIMLNPANTRAYDARGTAHAARGDMPEAIADFTRAIEFDPRRPEPWARRGMVRYQVGDKKGAASDYRKALEIAPANWPFRKDVERYLAEAEK